MPEYVGKMVICSRCGKEIFLKRTEVKSDWDKEYDVYETIPKDWLYITELGGHLCDGCSFTFKNWVSSFMYGKIAPAWDVNYREPKEVSE